MKPIRMLLIAGAGCLSASCSLRSDLANETPIIPTDSLALSYPPGKPWSNGNLQTATSALDARLDALDTNFKNSGSVNEVMIFVHGGLTGQADGIDSARDKLKRIQGADSERKIFPIFITWDSGLASSYAWHLARDGNGITDISADGRSDELRAIGRAPVMLLTDVAAGVANTPKTFYNSTAKTLQNSERVYQARKDLFFTRKHYEDTLKNLAPGWTAADGAYHKAGTKAPFEFSLGAEHRNADNYAEGTIGFTFLPLTTVLTPAYEGVGRPGWDNMKRRARTLVHRHPTVTDLASDKDVAVDGVMPEVLRRVKKWQDARRAKGLNLKVTFAGHSMGTIVLNETFRAMEDDKSCDVKVDKVIYMAAACSIRDFRDTVGRYMTVRNTDCETYSLCLHPKREVGERFRSYLPLVYSGSLLTWIDEFFESPEDFQQRTFGSFENCIIAYKLMPPTSRFHLKAFDDKVSFLSRLDESAGPQKHGEVASFRFWEDRYYRPVLSGRAPSYGLVVDSLY